MAGYHLFLVFEMLRVPSDARSERFPGHRYGRRHLLKETPADVFVRRDVETSRDAAKENE